MSILSEILEWAEQQNDWKQDTVRRIIENGNYTLEDMKELTDMILCKYGYIQKIEVHPKLIDKSKFITVEDSKKHKVILKKITALKNVNALSADAELKFAINGLTIIYGENGVGKSGYTRILKKCCKAREVDEVLPNVYKGESQESSRASILYSHNNKDHKLEWINDEYQGDILNQLVVYDSKCGKMQVINKNELIYLPNGTDIFKKLVDCIRSIKEELIKVKPQECSVSLDKIEKSTETYRIINNVTKETDKEELSKELKWGEEEENNISELSKKIIETNEEEIKKKIKVITKEIKNIEDLKSYIEFLERSCSQEEIQRICKLVKTKSELEIALNDLTQGMQTGNLKGTGNELWRVMYDTAKEFSMKNVYVNHDYPNLDGKCVLCQQELDKEARERMDIFSKFAEGKIKKKLDEITDKIHVSIQFFEKDISSKTTSASNVLKSDFLCISEDENKQLTEYIKKIKKIHFEIVKILEGTESEEKIEYIDPSVSKISSVKGFLNKATAKKLEIEDTINPEYIANLKKDSLELNSLKIGNSRINDIYKRIDYLCDIEKYEKMLKELNHTAISKKGNEIITKTLKADFLNTLSSELIKLGGQRIPLAVNSSTREGKPIFQLSLHGANMPQKSKIDSILSEGEQKIASLAGLLAEIGTSKHKNGIILDDPVTSLDHLFRNRIAERLVDEAKTRQIIIFTHDIAFLLDLEYFAKKKDVPAHLQSIRKEGIHSGIVCEGNPWHAQGVKDRIKNLKNDVENLKQMNLKEEKYNQAAGVIYGRLRETWERLIEEVLFNKVITRFSQGIQTQMLNGVFVDDEDYKTIYFTMSDCSKYMIGHDKSLSLSDARPDIKGIEEDIEKIEKFYKKTRKRKDDTVSKRKKYIDQLPQAEVVD